MTQEIKLPKGIKRVTLLGASPNAAPVVIRPDSEEKKQTKQVRPLEKLARRNADATRAFADVYAARHRRSNRKKRDGWLRDLAQNLVKASGKARKKLKIGRLLLW